LNRKRTTRRRRLSLAVLVIALASVALIGSGTATAVDAPLHPLNVTATTSIDRACAWSITKTGPTHLTLAVGESFDVPYDVAVTKSCTDTNRVKGTISGTGNPTSVAVSIGGTSGTTSCSYNAGNDTFSCTYEVDPPTTADGVVNAVANYSGGGTADNAPGTPYTFAGAPVKVTEESVDVFDSFAGTLAVHLDHSQTFHYVRTISFGVCGQYTIENTARVVDGTELGRVTHTLVVDVPCHGTGCTLTQGYWKTHSKYGPAAKPDATWNLLPGGLGPDTVFFLSGQTWIQVFTTAPQGNPYYILAHQYMAARLNILDGASSTPAVDSAIAWATTFFNTYTPSSSLGKSVKNAALNAASLLDSYNSGAIGPGHCDE
jgi:type II secretory pathway pseudopilin PulG